MPTPSVPASITFHVKLGNTEVTIKAQTLAELLDGTRLKKKELLELWKLNIRTYDKRHDHPGGITLDELFKLATALKVPYLDIARLVYQQCEADPDARKAPVSSLE